MKKIKFNLVILIPLVACLSAFASSWNYSPTLVYYQIGLVGTTAEDCPPHLVNKTCTQIGLGCIDDIENVGNNVQLYGDRIPIPDSDRFKCIIILKEDDDI